MICSLKPIAQRPLMSGITHELWRDNVADENLSNGKIDSMDQPNLNYTSFGRCFRGRGKEKSVRVKE
ncbi:unnamed protein product [Anisakis simplex]|uniref:Uncharacterized protein n=1 Tax=Anisakis simplex TaxID=6269 RepID=A0A0M3KBH8_ANISI|nr:unnamed protein product [Anisakis simplex]